MKLCIRNGRLIDPANNVDDVTDLYVENGFVTAIGTAPAGFSAAHAIDASALVVCPGLIDARARTREPGLEKKATMESETLAALAGGITTMCCPPDTYPVIDTPAMVQMIQQRSWQLGRTFIHPLGALTVGLKGEKITDMASLADAGCVGVSNALEPTIDTLVMRRALQYALSFDLKVFLHAVDPWLKGNGVVHEGEISTRLGLPAVPEAAETVGVARELALIEQTGAEAHFCQISSARALDMIGEARQRGLRVSCDVTAHQLHLCEHDVGVFDARCNVDPPLRSERDRDALRQGICDGTISLICSDHQPHGADARLVPFSEAEPGISGLETLLPLTLKLVDDGLLDLKQAIGLLTSGPAEVLGLESGQLGIGATADVCLFDPDDHWTLDASAMVSRGKNTPFDGWSFRGRVRQTLIGGNPVYIQSAVENQQ